MLTSTAGQSTKRVAVGRRAAISAVILLLYAGLLWSVPPMAILFSLVAGVGLGVVWRTWWLLAVIAGSGVVLSIIYHLSRGPEINTGQMVLLGFMAGWLPAIVGAAAGLVTGRLVAESLDR